MNRKLSKTNTLANHRKDNIFCNIFYNIICNYLTKLLQISHRQILSLPSCFLYSANLLIYRAKEASMSGRSLPSWACTYTIISARKNCYLIWINTFKRTYLWNPQWVFWRIFTKFAYLSIIGFFILQENSMIIGLDLVWRTWMSKHY